MELSASVDRTQAPALAIYIPLVLAVVWFLTRTLSQAMVVYPSMSWRPVRAMLAVEATRALFFHERPAIAVSIPTFTKAVEAIEVSLSQAVAVGTCGSPVSTGELMLALRLMLFWRVVSALVLLVISVERFPERVAMLPVAVARLELVVARLVVRVAMLPVAVARLVLVVARLVVRVAMLPVAVATLELVVLMLFWRVVSAVVTKAVVAI